MISLLETIQALAEVQDQDDLMDCIYRLLNKDQNMWVCILEDGQIIQWDASRTHAPFFKNANYLPFRYNNEELCVICNDIGKCENEYNESASMMFVGLVDYLYGPVFILKLT